MAGSQPSLKIDHDDLFSDEVEDYLAVQQNLRQNRPEAEPLAWWVRILYSNWFYLSLAAGVGAFLAWAVLEPFTTDLDEEGVDVAGLLLFPTVAAGVGLFLGAAEGLMCRNLGRAAFSALVGTVVGFFGGGLLLIPAGIVFVLAVQFAVELGGENGPEGLPSGVGLLVFMMGRATAWAITAIAAGIGQGTALWQGKVVLNGVLGAALGGLLGGLLFDPLYLLLPAVDGEAALSRCVGLTLIGLMVGLFVGLIEGWTKNAWLLMKHGPLAGKQFILHRDSTVLGSSPRCEIYLFKDPAIEPRHAIIHNRGGRFEIEDCDTPDGTFVNDRQVAGRAWLQSGDTIGLGDTVLEFSLRDTE
jgi:hypothetical protein